MSEGRLVVVATPIGNTKDISPRALQALGEADLVCCEDTRHSGRLFSMLGVKPRRLLSLHAHNEAARSDEVLAALSEGRTVAVVTDAGTPAVSDPGARLVAKAHAAGVTVSSVPGPSAATAAVSLAGFTDGRWRFEGFLPRSGSERRARLATLAGSLEPSVVYESPKRLALLLKDLASFCGEGREVVVCRELTKLHEEVVRSSLGEAALRFSGETRGEIVLVLSGADEAPGLFTTEELARLVEELLAGGSTRRDAVEEVAERTGSPRRLVYEALRPPAKSPSSADL